MNLFQTIDGKTIWIMANTFFVVGGLGLLYFGYKISATLLKILEILEMSRDRL